MQSQSLASLYRRVEAIEHQLRNQNELGKENQRLEEEKQTLNLKVKQLQDRLESAECVAIWDSEAGEILSVADFLDRRD